MKCKTFNYKNYKNCTFEVSSYVCDDMAIAIQMIDGNSEAICTPTVYREGIMYEPGFTTIKNYSENAGMTKFLIKIGVVEQVYSKIPCNIYAGKDETIDYCKIDMKKLKEFSSEFTYRYDFE